MYASSARAQHCPISSKLQQLNIFSSLFYFTFQHHPHKTRFIFCFWKLKYSREMSSLFKQYLHNEVGLRLKLNPSAHSKYRKYRSSPGALVDVQRWMRDEVDVYTQQFLQKFNFITAVEWLHRTLSFIQRKCARCIYERLFILTILYPLVTHSSNMRARTCCRWSVRPHFLYTNNQGTGV